jgi:RNA polymerase sigma factor (sigma-70 family)
MEVMVLEISANELQSNEKIVKRAIFEYCYRKYYKRVLAYCRAVYGFSGSVEDAVQDAFLLFWTRGVRRVNLALNPEAYIRVIARNIFCRIRRCKRFDSLHEEKCRGCDPYRARLNFYELISSLSGEEQRLMELCYLYGCDRLEAARESRISRRTCFRRLAHAKRQLLRGCLR